MAQTFAQIFGNLFDNTGVGARKNKQIFGAFAGSRENNQIFGKKFRLVRNHRAVEIDRLRKWPSVFARDKVELTRFLIRRDERAEKICRNAAAASADAGRGPGDGFAEDILPAENGGQAAKGRLSGQLRRRVEIGRAV